MATAQQEFLRYEKEKIACYLWGEGNRKVLLLPGWNSRAAHFRNYIEQLAALNYQVIGIDPIGHGRSTGHWTNIRQYLASIEIVSAQYGPFYAAIGHSFGGFSIPFAFNRHRLAERVVLLATPASLEWLFQRFCRIIDASEPIQNNMKLRIEDMLGLNCWQQFDIRCKAGTLGNVNALIVHDEQDNAVPLEHASDIQHSWPGAKLLLTRQLGHQRLLRHPSAVKPVIDFLQQD